MLLECCGNNTFWAFRMTRRRGLASFTMITSMRKAQKVCVLAPHDEKTHACNSVWQNFTGLASFFGCAALPCPHASSGVWCLGRVRFFRPRSTYLSSPYIHLGFLFFWQYTMLTSNNKLELELVSMFMWSERWSEGWQTRLWNSLATHTSHISYKMITLCW